MNRAMSDVSTERSNLVCYYYTTYNNNCIRCDSVIKCNNNNAIARLIDYNK